MLFRHSRNLWYSAGSTHAMNRAGTRTRGSTCNGYVAVTTATRGSTSHWLRAASGSLRFRYYHSRSGLFTRSVSLGSSYPR
jgi:hypothetical protein